MTHMIITTLLSTFNFLPPVSLIRAQRRVRIRWHPRGPYFQLRPSDRIHVTSCHCSLPLKSVHSSLGLWLYNPQAASLLSALVIGQSCIPGMDFSFATWPHYPNPFFAVLIFLTQSGQKSNAPTLVVHFSHRFLSHVCTYDLKSMLVQTSATGISQSNVASLWQNAHRSFLGIILVTSWLIAAPLQNVSFTKLVCIYLTTVYLDILKQIFHNHSDFLCTKRKISHSLNISSGFLNIWYHYHLAHVSNANK